MRGEFPADPEVRKRREPHLVLAPGADRPRAEVLLTRMRTPGAIELLAAYEQMPPDARTSLVGLLRAVTSSETSVKARQLA
jgi:hypothetical protein